MRLCGAKTFWCFREVKPGHMLVPMSNKIHGSAGRAGASFRRRIRGASLAEYGVISGLVAMVAIGSVSAVGGKVSSTLKSARADLALAHRGTDPEC